ncbi:MAG: ABC transporter permease [Candidatus Eiseniibacteriota bacterium]
MTTRTPAGPGTRLARRFGTASWLGWQIEANWTDPFTFVIYSVLRPLATALILAVMYSAVAGVATGAHAFLGFYVANAFHEYVTRMLVGMGWMVVEEREEYETLKYVYASPVGIFTYLWGRSTVKFAQATLSLILILAMGWVVMGLRWDWGAVRWGPLLLTVALGLVAVVHFGFVVAGWALVLPRAAISVNEGVAAGLYLMCGVIFPIDLLPRALQLLALALPFTWWYEALRRFMLGRGASAVLGGRSDVQLLLGLALSTAVLSCLSVWGYHALERHARRQGKLDQATLF